MKFNKSLLLTLTLVLGAPSAMIKAAEPAQSQEAQVEMPPTPTLAEIAAAKVNQQLKKMSKEQQLATLANLPKEMRELALKTNFTEQEYTLFFLIEGNLLRLQEYTEIFLNAAKKGLAVPSLIAWLKEKGVDPRTAVDKENQNALMLGANNIEMVRILLDEGVDPNHTSKHGYTALMQAVRGGNPEIVQLLIDAGADVNKADTLSRETALMIIAGSRWARYPGAHELFAERVKLLLDAGADRNAKNSDGLTAEEIAKRQQNSELAEIIRNYTPASKSVNAAACPIPAVPKGRPLPPTPKTAPWKKPTSATAPVPPVPKGRPLPPTPKAAPKQKGQWKPAGKKW